MSERHQQFEFCNLLKGMINEERLAPEEYTKLKRALPTLPRVEGELIQTILDKIRGEEVEHAGLLRVIQRHQCKVKR